MVSLKAPQDSILGVNSDVAKVSTEQAERFWIFEEFPAQTALIPKWLQGLASFPPWSIAWSLEIAAQ